MKYATMIFALAAATAVMTTGFAAADDALFAAPLEAGELENHRAKASQYHAQLGQLSEQAVLTDNEIGSAHTGNNALSHGAFSSANGVTSVIQNTGNHVIIQDAVVVNVTVSQ